MTKKNVLIIGASSDPSRYSFQCAKMLLERGYPIILVHPKDKTILNHEVISDLENIKEAIHTITLYVNPSISSKMIDSLVKLNPVRVIMNPGSENEELEVILKMKKVEVVKGCSLVMLTTRQF